MVAFWLLLFLTFLYASHGSLNSNDSISEQNRNLLDTQPEGDYQVQWTMSLGGNEIIIESDYLRVGLEQAVKDYINLDLKCNYSDVSKSPNKVNIPTSFRSVAIANIRNTSKNKISIVGNSVCNGNPDICKVGLQKSTWNKKKYQVNVLKSNDGISEECQKFLNTTIFDFFEDIFETGLFFDYKVDIATEKEELKETMELDYNISFIPAQMNGLNKIEEIAIDVNNVKTITTHCNDTQCKDQKSVILELFDHFGILADANEHECSYRSVNCDRNNLVKYLFIGK